MSNTIVIVKIQRPLHSNVEAPPFLVYDETQEIEFFIEPGDERFSAVAEALGDSAKKFFPMDISDFSIDLDNEAEEQAW